MTQTFALLLDSYRELNAKRLFWIALAVSALAVVVFASLGLSDDSSLTVLTWTTPVHFPFITRPTFYRQMFVTWGVSLWLSWAACILALISTAGVFPDLMAGGSIDLYLSKPIARLRLFATKVLGGMLFVTLQVLLFCAASFLVLRARGGVWEPGLFVAVPLVVLMFSYLFAVCVLVGVLTRSTIAALLLTLLFWLSVAGVQVGERVVLTFQAIDHRRATDLDRQIADVQARLDGARAAAGPTTAPNARQPGAIFQTTLASLRDQRRAWQPNAALALTDRILFGVLTPLPKTSGTIEVLERQLVRLTDLPPVPTAAPPSIAGLDADAEVGTPPPPGPADRRLRRRRDRDEREANDREVDVQLRRRSAGWVLGTSCAFEAVVLGLAGWVFCRRDY